MLYITNRQKIQEYRDSPAIDQSSLKKLLSGMKEFLSEREEKITEPMIIGSAVDTILTGEEGDFEELFYISSCPKPSDLLCSILQEVLDRSQDKQLPLEDNQQILEEVIEAFSYQPNWKIATRVNKVLENAAYYESLQKSLDKVVISEEQLSIITSIVDSLRTNMITESFFAREKYANNLNWDIYYQLPIYWSYQGIDCKGLLDIVIVRKEEGIVKDVIPIDLKIIMDKVLNFHNNARLRRYDIQGSYYTDGLLLSNSLPFEVNENTIRNFKFVVESYTETGTPLLLESSDEFLEIGRNGLPEIVIDGRVVRQEILGYRQLLELYSYYQEQGWQEEKLIYDSNGVLVLDWDKIHGY